MESILKSLLGLDSTTAATTQATTQAVTDAATTAATTATDTTTETTSEAIKGASSITEKVINNPDEIGNFFSGFADTMGKFAWNLLIAILIWVVGIIAIKLLTGKILPVILKRSKISEDFHRFILTTIKVILYIVIIIVGVNALGIHTYSLVAVFGAGVVAIGLSLQGSLSNFAGGILLLIFKPFIKGDYISVKGVEGIVLTVSILYTKIRTLDNRVIMLPNGNLANSDIENHFVNGIRRVDVDFVIPYSEDLLRVKEVMRDAMLTNEYIIKEQGVFTIVLSLDPEGIHIQNRSWCKSPDYWNALFRMGEIVAAALTDNDIVVAASSSVQVKMVDPDFNKMGTPKSKRRTRKQAQTAAEEAMKMQQAEGAGETIDDENDPDVKIRKNKISDEYGNVNTRNTYEAVDEEVEERDKMKSTKKPSAKTEKKTTEQTIEVYYPDDPGGGIHLGTVPTKEEDNEKKEHNEK